MHGLYDVPLRRRFKFFFRNNFLLPLRKLPTHPTVLRRPKRLDVRTIDSRKLITPTSAQK